MDSETHAGEYYSVVGSNHDQNSASVAAGCSQIECLVCSLGGMSPTSSFSGSKRRKSDNAQQMVMSESLGSIILKVSDIIKVVKK